jgi:hypothetical protein
MSATASTSNLGMAFVDALVAPDALFKSYQHMSRHGHLVLMGILLATLFSHYFFFSNMSDEHLLAQQLAQVSDLTKSELVVVKDMMIKNLPYTGIFVGTMQAASILMQILLLSTFALLVARIRPQAFISSFKDTTALVSWCYIPAMVNALGLTLLTFTASTPDLPLSLASYASLNELVLHLHNNHPLYTWAQSLTIFDLWVVALLAVGFKNKLALTGVNASAVALLPVVIVYCVWFLIA